MPWSHHLVILGQSKRPEEPEERKFSTDELIEAPRLCGARSGHEVAGALHGQSRKTFTADQASKLANDSAGNTFKATAKPVLIGTAVVGATTMIFSMPRAFQGTDNSAKLNGRCAPERSLP